MLVHNCKAHTFRLSVMPPTLATVPITCFGSLSCVPFYILADAFFILASTCGHTSVDKHASRHDALWHFFHNHGRFARFGDFRKQLNCNSGYRVDHNGGVLEMTDLSRLDKCISIEIIWPSSSYAVAFRLPCPVALPHGGSRVGRHVFTIVWRLI